MVSSKLTAFQRETLEAFFRKELEIPSGHTFPGEVLSDDLRAYVEALVVRLRRAALPVS